MNKTSIAILEAMVSKFPELRTIYDLIDLPTIGNVPHPELANITEKFTKPDVVIISGLTFNCYLLQRLNSLNVVALKIASEVSYIETKRGKLVKMMDDDFTLKDFYPEPFSRKMVFITDYNQNSDETQGMIFSMSKNKYHLTVGNQKYFEPQEILNEPSDKIISKFLRAYPIMEKKE